MLHNLIIAIKNSRAKIILPIIYITLLFIIASSIICVLKFYNIINIESGSHGYGIAYKYKYNAVKAIKKFEISNKRTEPIFISNGINYFSTLPPEYFLFFKMQKINFENKYKANSPAIIIINKFLTDISDTDLNIIGKIIISQNNYSVLYLNNINNNPDPDTKKIYIKINDNPFIKMLYNSTFIAPKNILLPFF